MKTNLKLKKKTINKLTVERTSLSGEREDGKQDCTIGRENMESAPAVDGVNLRLTAVLSLGSHLGHPHSRTFRARFILRLIYIFN